MNKTEFEEKNHLTQINKNTLRQYQEWGLDETINIDIDLIAAQKWQEMLDLTQSDGKERSLVVSSDGKRLHTSKIFLGSRNTSGYPLLPHGLKSALPTTKDIVYIHTHYMPPELDHVKTTTVSDTDISNFLNLPGKAMVVIDRGGVHMLARQPYTANLRKDKIPGNIAENALKQAKKSSNTAQETMTIIAQKLMSFGIRYYFSENKNPSSANQIRLTDVSKTAF